MARIISIENIESGMILQQAVVNTNGQVLLGAGKELKPEFKRMMKMWGIGSVVIEGEEEITETSSINNNYSEEKIAAAKEIVNQKIKWTPRNLTEQELIDIALMVYIEEAGNK